MWLRAPFNQILVIFRIIFSTRPGALRHLIERTKKMTKRTIGKSFFLSRKQIGVIYCQNKIKIKKIKKASFLYFIFNYLKKKKNKILKLNLDLNRENKIFTLIKPKI